MDAARVRLIENRISLRGSRRRKQLCKLHYCTSMRVCVQVLRPNQPNGAMSRAVSLFNHTFTG